MANHQKGSIVKNFFDMVNGHTLMINNQYSKSHNSLEILTNEEILHQAVNVNILMVLNESMPNYHSVKPSL